MQTVKVKQSAGVSVKTSPAFWINRVKTKLATGEYPTEEVKCFCGSDKSVIVAHRDKFGIPHKMVLCQKCSIIYATPRMTQKTYIDFYNNEYRHIYDGWWYGGEAKDKDKIFTINCGLGHGFSFYTFIEHFDLPIDTVFEIGCNMGSWLLPFMEKGSDVYGVDYGREHVEFGKTKGINLIAGGIEELQKLDKKADLVILNHVLEHFLDMDAELAKIRTLLKPDGVLFVGVPGLFSSDLNLMFQNAHTYQFYSDSLEYVMSSCGFEEYYLDEYIMSLWKLSDPKNYTKYGVEGKLVSTRVRDIHDYFFSDRKRIPEIKTVNKFPLKMRKENIDKILSYGFKDLSELIEKHTGNEAIIISGGASIDNFTNEVKSLKDKGYVLICIERMYQWCLNRNIIPDYVVILDASDDVNESFGNLHPESTYLLSTQCRPDTAEILKDSKVYVYSTPQAGIDQHIYWDKNGYKRATLVNGGGSVALQSIAISTVLGIKDLHVFGFDSSFKDKVYAEGITGVGEIKKIFEVKIEDRVFKTTTSYLSFAQQFLKFYQMAKDLNMLDDVKIYGDSLVVAMCKENLSADRNA